MAEEWFVRVQGKEYGPVDLETLQEWKAEGRLIPQNEVRTGPDAAWLPAAQFPELFATEPPAPKRDPLFRRRTMGEIVSQSFRIYGRGFPKFLLLALMVEAPWLTMRLSLAFTQFRQGEPLSADSRMTAAVAIVMLAILLALWPVFVAAMQFATVDVASGRPLRLKEVLRGAVAIWPRIARLGLLVYGSFLFWTLLPLMLIAALLAQQSIVTLLLAPLALALQVYMAGRLFVNFLFWQQSCAIAGLEGAEALQESKDLGRSRSNEPRLRRPLYRGAIIVSVWVLVLLAASVAVELPFTIIRLRGVATIEQAVAVMQQLLNAPRPDAMTLAVTVLSSLVHAILRPLLAIAFVVLYFDAKGG